MLPPVDPSDLQFEQTIVSPHVNQFMTDYMFVKDKLSATGVERLIDTAGGDADLALSIVNDAYNQHHVSEQIEHDLQAKQYRVSAEA